MSGFERFPMREPRQEAMVSALASNDQRRRQEGGGYSSEYSDPAPLMSIGRGAMPQLQPSVGMSASPLSPEQSYGPQGIGRGRGYPSMYSGPTTQPPETQQREKPRNPGIARLKPITADLVIQYETNKKNPISVVNEYCQVNRLSVAFNEVPVEIHTLTAMFAVQCVIDGRPFQQGVAKTKKDAKTISARIAFEQIIAATEGLEEEDFDDNECSDDEVKTDQTADKYNLGNKHPLMMLHEYAGKKGMNLEVKVHDQKMDHGFRCDVVLEGELVTTTYANSKQEAKRRAGEEALRSILANEIPSQTEKENLMHFDIMRELVRTKIDELWGTLPPFIPRPSRCAAFIIKRSPEHRGEVVALGTGSDCLTGRNIKFNGRVLLDCHAEVIARRALLKWFYTQINLVFQGRAADSVFEINDVTDKLRLQECVSLHLYVSTAPCGDAAAFPISTTMILGEEEKKLILLGEHRPNTQEPSFGQLRMKLEFGTTTTPVDRLVGELSFETYFNLSKSGEGKGRDSQRREEGDEQLRSMSCSDKIFKWNVVGLQGSLLSLFMEPVYINSITLGNEFNLGHLVRAVCCRLPADVSLGVLPSGYVGDRHPIVGRVSVYDAMGPDGGSGHNLSVNWCWDETNALVEVVDSATGISIAASPFQTGPTRASRLCKAGFFYRFNVLARDTQQTDWLRPLYRETKQVSTAYQDVKGILYRQLGLSGLGRWITRPIELENFGS